MSVREGNLTIFVIPLSNVMDYACTLFPSIDVSMVEVDSDHIKMR